MKQKWIKKALFGSCWSIILWFFLIGMFLGFFVMGIVAIGILPKEFYGLSNLIASITGASTGSLLLFMIPLSIAWHKNKEVRTTLIILSVIASILNGVFHEFAIYMLILIVSIVVSCATKKQIKK